MSTWCRFRESTIHPDREDRDGKICRTKQFVGTPPRPGRRGLRTNGTGLHLSVTLPGIGAKAHGDGIPTGKSALSADIDVADVVALAEQIPLLTVNLNNNYKHSANPVLQGGSKGEWDEAGIERPVVLHLGREDWRLWYSCAGKGRSIGLATSKDGVHWEKHPGNPVFEPAEDWEGGYISPTSVLWVNGEFYLYYWGPGHMSHDSATGRRLPPRMKYIALATSEDGQATAHTGAAKNSEQELSSRQTVSWSPTPGRLSSMIFTPVQNSAEPGAFDSRPAEPRRPSARGLR